MMRLAVFALLAILLTIGGWSQGGATGYERGKADATNALTPHGVVVDNGDGTCLIATQAGQSVSWPSGRARSLPVLLLTPIR